MGTSLSSNLVFNRTCQAPGITCKGGPFYSQLVSPNIHQWTFHRNHGFTRGGTRESRIEKGKGGNWGRDRHHWTQRNAKKVISSGKNVSPLPTIMSGPSLPSFVSSTPYLRTVFRLPWKHNILQLLGNKTQCSGICLQNGLYFSNVYFSQIFTFLKLCYQ